ncbi:Tigger transposable element-derived protein 7-like 71 [Homarus americanus]|uniref:Tigger transposable element-derived protein 7-like 71 n=1 Tax=Homarus americanus TaxID=6706 RepID=A0A8J5N8Y9_HOMAM|nr:Tigger transposable element-derived protein 7-like 71 [Homarus americanus]
MRAGQRQWLGQELKQVRGSGWDKGNESGQRQWLGQVMRAVRGSDWDKGNVSGSEAVAGTRGEQYAKEDVCDPFCEPETGTYKEVRGWCFSDEYGVKKQTVSDISKAQDKLTVFSLKYNVDANFKSSSVGARKHRRVAKDTNLEEAVTKWFVQQRSCGNVVRGVEIQAAAAKLASHMGIENFEASDAFKNEDEEDDEPLPKKPKLSVIRESIDNVILYIELSAETDDVQHYYQHIRAFRELIIQKQHQQGKQLKLDSFFKPVHPNPAAAVKPADDIDDPPAADSGHPQSPQPSTSGGQGPVEHHSSTDFE